MTDLLLLPMAFWLTTGACQVRENKESVPPTVFMENAVISVKLLPSSHGIIDDMRLKSNHLPTLLAYREKRRELLPGSGIYYQKKLHANGNLNALWPGGWSTFRGAHAYRVEKGTSEEATVVVSQDVPGWRIERRLTLRARTAALDAVVRITNTGKEVKRKAYWNLSILRLADTLLSMPGDDSEMLLMPARREERAVQGISLVVKDTHIRYRGPEGPKNVFLPPAQPWMAAIDKTHKLAFATVLDSQEFPDEAVYYSSRPGAAKTYYTMELIFPPADYAPGQSHEYRQRFMVFAGLGDIDLVRPGWALKIVRIDEHAGDVAVKVALLSARAGKTITLGFGIRDAEGQEVAGPVAARFEDAGPDMPIYADIRLPVAELPAGWRLVIRDEDGGSHEIVRKKKIWQKD